MAMVDIDKELYEKIKKIVKENKIEYPTHQNFVNKAVNKLIIKEESEIDTNGNTNTEATE